MAVETGVVRLSRRSRGTGRVSTEGAVNSGNTAVLKTTGKLATSPRGSGAATRTSVARTSARSTPGVARQTGRVAVPRTTGKS